MSRRRVLFFLLSSTALLCQLATATVADVNTEDELAFFTTLGFKCKEVEEGSGPAVGCAVGEEQLSLDIFDKGIGQVGMRLNNRGGKRSVVSEIYVVDEAGLMRPDSLALHSDGMIHFRQSKKEYAFPALSAEDKQPQKADLALLRRKEVSKVGRFLRSNGVSNGNGPLTLLMKTTNAALDAELVAEASHECLLRIAVVLTDFETDPRAGTTFLSNCLSST